MKELSLHILDIAKNSVRAGAALTQILLQTDANNWLTLRIVDDGCGMDKEMLSRVTDPFCTTRTTRKVGMGLPLLKMAAEATGGSLTLRSDVSPERHGTALEATFDTTHIDCMPLGDIVSTICLLIQGDPDTDFLFEHKRYGKKTVALDTRELREVLGGISLAEYEVQEWIRENLTEQYGN